MGRYYFYRVDEYGRDVCDIMDGIECNIVALYDFVDKFYDQLRRDQIRINPRLTRRMKIALQRKQNGETVPSNYSGKSLAQWVKDYGYTVNTSPEEVQSPVIDPSANKSPYIKVLRRLSEFPTESMEFQKNTRAVDELLAKFEADSTFAPSGDECWEYWEDEPIGPLAVGTEDKIDLPGILASIKESLPCEEQLQREFYERMEKKHNARYRRRYMRDTEHMEYNEIWVWENPELGIEHLNELNGGGRKKELGSIYKDVCEERKKQKDLQGKKSKKK